MIWIEVATFQVCPAHSRLEAVKPDLVEGLRAPARAGQEAP